MPEFTDDGIQIENLTEITNDISSGLRGIYGQDISLDSDSPDGQRVGITAKLIADVQLALLALYNSLDADLAAGVSLQRMSKISGITQRAPTKSSWDLTIDASQPLTLPTNYAVLDDLGQTWEIVNPGDIPAGPTIRTFLAQDFGPVSNVAGAQLTQAVVVRGVTSVTAPSTPLIGSDEETTQEFRIRRAQSVQNPSYTTTGGLYARISNTVAVTDAQVYENDTNDYDPVLDLNAHSLWVIVEGGAVQDIAEVIAKNRTAGVGLKGTIDTNYVEKRVRPDGTDFDVVHPVRFDRPTIASLYVKVNATRKNPTQPVDIALIAERIADTIYNIGGPAVATEIYARAYGDEPNAANFYLTSLVISDDDVTYVDTELTPSLNGKFEIDTSNVDVTEIIP